MADASYIAASLLWAIAGFMMGIGAGSIVRLMWINPFRK